jgi:hypothetical protein
VSSSKHVMHQKYIHQRLILAGRLGLRERHNVALPTLSLDLTSGAGFAAGLHNLARKPEEHKQLRDPGVHYRIILK